MTLYSVNKKTNVSVPLIVNMDEVFSAENYGMFRIIMIETGTGMIKINENSIVFMAPCLLCLNEKDTVELLKQLEVKASVIYFDPSIINSSFTMDTIYELNNSNKSTHIQDYFYLDPFIRHTAELDNYFEIGITMRDRIVDLFKRLERETKLCSNDFWVCRSRSFFLEILFLIQYMYTDTQSENKIKFSNTWNDVNDIILYLHANYQNKITIDDLTKEFHMNRTTLSKKFHDAAGMSIKDYLIKLRIKVAAVMIRDTVLPISEIVYRSGFNEINHFGRVFKKYMGCTPSEYRKYDLTALQKEISGSL